jgi:hypothetical protein
MKLRTVIVSTGVLLLCLQHSIHAQNKPESNIPALGNAFTGGPATPSKGVHQLSAEAQRIEAALDQRLWALANVICHEQIARFARKGKTTNQLDTLDVNVEVLGGIEKYSRILLKQKQYPNMQKLPGTWSIGEMATLLSATRDAIDMGDVQVGEEEVSDLGRSSTMTFSYAAGSQRWYLRANSQLHWLSFEGRVWTSPDTGEIRRISWYARDLPSETGVAQVLWTVDFSTVDLSSLVVTLPEKALFQITYKNGDDRVDWNVTHFSEYRRYGADTAVHFDE